MHSKIKITPVAPKCLAMSDQARAVIERGQRAFRQRQEQMSPAPKAETGDDRAVREAIESVRADRQKREAAIASLMFNQSTLLSQVSGVPMDQLHTLKHD